MQSTITRPSHTTPAHADVVSRSILSFYRILRERLRVMLTGKSALSDYREQNLLDENMGPEIRRIH
ncbi:MAG: hypothetical protein QNI91_13565 [Arenicellales bacterium]|nr:hypothetical protein [Arenicellales bacterium]